MCLFHHLILCLSIIEQIKWIFESSYSILSIARRLQFQCLTLRLIRWVLHLSQFLWVIVDFVQLHLSTVGWLDHHTVVVPWLWTLTLEWVLLLLEHALVGQTFAKSMRRLCHGVRSWILLLGPILTKEWINRSIIGEDSLDVLHVAVVAHHLMLVSYLIAGSVVDLRKLLVLIVRLIPLHAVLSASQWLVGLRESLRNSWCSRRSFGMNLARIRCVY